MKIKKKVKMNLHELIQWARENNVKGETFTSNYGRNVKFYSDVSFNTMEPIYHWDTFTVEAEEEITEDTVIPFIVELYTNNHGLKETSMHLDNTISNILSINKILMRKNSIFYMINDDATMTLIWKDGELVE
ncbi:hypothetical protein Q7221_001499 [Staphylococcus pseudintermedius]|nr:hypothetical protein [Staphylococcus pseudintermedius]ELI3932257.1 hypothetical protein [Staphylococcus pseudintermedius]